jgi:ABC-type amino acid transport substrate-binding protein
VRAFLILLLVFIHHFAVAKPTDIQLVALKNDTPFAFVNNDTSSGLLPELLAQVSKVMPEYNIKLDHVSFRDIENRKLPQNTLGFLGAYFRINEWNDVYPYSYPIYHEQMCIVCTNQNNEGIKLKSNKIWPEDYKDAKLGTVRNYSGWETYGVDARKIGTMNVFEYPNPELAIMAVHKGLVDCVLFEETVFHSLVKEYTKSNKLSKSHSLVVSTRLQRDSLHIAYFADALDEKNEGFIKAFDKAFAKLLMENKLKPIYDKYGVRY